MPSDEVAAGRRVVAEQVEVGVGADVQAGRDEHREPLRELLRAEVAGLADVEDARLRAGVDDAAVERVDDALVRRASGVPPASRAAGRTASAKRLSFDHRIATSASGSYPSSASPIAAERGAELRDLAVDAAGLRLCGSTPPQ